MPHEPVAPIATPDADSGRERPRASVEERAERRERLRAGHDRYTALLRTLQAGREVRLARPRSGHWGIEWHPIMRTLVLAAIAAVVLWFGARAGLDWIRRGQVTTWSGPDATVQSGQVLGDCAVVNAIDNPVYPSWVRRNGGVYRYTGSKRPFTGTDFSNSFTDTRYQTGDLHLYLIDDTPDGSTRDTIMLWFGGGIAGVEYARTPECT
ncbi:MAG: hypothetical protein ACHQNA_14130 [Acidimicrobiales bacterium]